MTCFLNDSINNCLIITSSYFVVYSYLKTLEPGQERRRLFRYQLTKKLVLLKKIRYGHLHQCPGAIT